MELSIILAQMANYTTDAIMITKSDAGHDIQDQRILYINKSFVDLTGYETQDVIGKHPRMLYGPKTDRKTLARIAAAVESRKPISIELMNYSKEGHEYWVEINISPIFAPDNPNDIYFLAAERDITERKNAEAQLIRAIQKAEIGTRAKSEFLANMSHELRTPMNGILGLAEILQGMELNDEVRECVDAIYSSGASLMGILNDILDLSKIEAQELEIESYPFRTQDILKNIRDLTQVAALRKSLNYDIQMNMNVPEWLKGDGKRIQQVIFNLVGNAIKFTEKGGVNLSVNWKEDGNNKGMLHISVQDTGIGIPDEFQKNLFDKFSQADTSISRKFGGTGLGLAITKYLVEMMGGKISFTSKVNHGTTFMLAIPISPAPQQDVRDTENKNLAEEKLQGIDTNQVRALVVEDHPINQMLVIKWLKKLGIRTIDSAMNGFDSISLLRNNQYDFILMDCQMPELDGYETTSLIRDMEKQMDRRTPIIAMTANAMLGEREKCLNAGMDDYLSKPLNFTQFRKCIAGWIGADDKAQISIDESVMLPTSLMDDSVPVDLRRLEEFTEGDKNIEQVVINLFLETAYESFGSLKEAILKGDPDAWKKAAHSLKGASGNLGAMTLHTLCSNAEMYNNEDEKGREELLNGLYAEFSRVENYLKGLN
ncbi:MAG: ATP-binding protein [Pseudobdellovibrionaceae bacterium]